MNGWDLAQDRAVQSYPDHDSCLLLTANDDPPSRYVATSAYQPNDIALS